ncbi:MAG: hypothetical protein H7175_19640 [Burkholderiales bacterium]|nr:hypothetical protein [Anaerolineae bacterium]
MFNEVNNLIYLLFGLLIVVAISFAVWSLVWREQRGGELIEQWAQDNGYRFVSRERPAFNKGPFTWNSRYQEVYYVIVVDAEGQQHSGWVKLGGQYSGMHSDQVEVRWDK